jgi:enoyl-CoA hydratase
MFTFETIEVNIQDHVATLCLNRPKSRNALNFKMCHELTQACAQLTQMKDVHVVLITSKGEVFCAGADLKERQDMSDEQVVARRVAGFTAYAAIEALPMAVIAVVQGAAFGSGCEIAGACDWVLASRAAQFKYPEVGWGTVGATQRLPRIVGARMAKELLFTGRVFDAAEACALGFVNHVYEADELSRFAMSMAQQIAQANPITLQLTKKSIDDGLESTKVGAMGIELLAIQENIRNSDWKKAISQFAVKS